MSVEQPVSFEYESQVFKLSTHLLPFVIHLTAGAIPLLEYLLQSSSVVNVWLLQEFNSQVDGVPSFVLHSPSLLTYYSQVLPSDITIAEHFSSKLFTQDTPFVTQVGALVPEYLPQSSFVVLV